MNTIRIGLGLAIVAGAFILVSSVDYHIAKSEARVTYTHPVTEAPCRDPVAEKEIRIWIDKRLTESEGIRTCRVIPLGTEDSPRKIIRKL